MSNTAKKIKPIEASPDTVIANVFSSVRSIETPEITLPKGIRFNERLKVSI